MTLELRQIRVQGAADLTLDPIRALVQVCPGEAQDRPAFEFDVVGAYPVVIERQRGVVGLTAIRLDGQFDAGPGHVQPRIHASVRREQFELQRLGCQIGQNQTNAEARLERRLRPAVRQSQCRP